MNLIGFEAFARGAASDIATPFAEAVFLDIEEAVPLLDVDDDDAFSLESFPVLADELDAAGRDLVRDYIGYGALGIVELTFLDAYDLSFLIDADNDSARFRVKESDDLLGNAFRNVLFVFNKIVFAGLHGFYLGKRISETARKNSQ